jgi:hypothetical protein
LRSFRLIFYSHSKSFLVAARSGCLLASFRVSDAALQRKDKAVAITIAVSLLLFFLLARNFQKVYYSWLYQKQTFRKVLMASWKNC